MTPAHNRVTPLGDIEAFPLRGAWTGNRGILHRDKEIVRFHAGDLWIVCALEFRGRWREQWQPGHYTFLFFHDEAVAFAVLDEAPAVVVGDQLVEWTQEGYGERRSRPVRGTANVITPPSSVAALRAGYPVQIDDSARG